jgi:hypothetical protein
MQHHINYIIVSFPQARPTFVCNTNAHLHVCYFACYTYIYNVHTTRERFFHSQAAGIGGHSDDIRQGDQILDKERKAQRIMEGGQEESPNSSDNDIYEDD